jgi:hypothetical protein
VAAQDAFSNALRWNPADEAIRERLKLCEQIIALDPAIRGLISEERYRRSGRLVEETLGALEQCTASHVDSTPPDSLRELMESARKTLSKRSRLISYGDVAESNDSLAVELWTSREKLCGASGAAEEALERVIAKLPK